MEIGMSVLDQYQCVCLDTSPFIYYMEDNPIYIQKVSEIFLEISLGSISGISSYISLLEVLVKPIQQGAHSLASLYRDLMLDSTSLRLYPLDKNVSEHAANLRARYSIRTPDAIQIATGLVNGADVFLTNDTRLKQVHEINVVVLDEII
jgi:predicted nucleic acid-binding protein